MFEGEPNNDRRKEFLERQQCEREQQSQLRLQTAAATKIQTRVRGFLTRRQFAAKVRCDFDDVFSEFETQTKCSLPTAVRGFERASMLFLVFDVQKDETRFTWLCRYLIQSSESTDAKKSCVALALTKDKLLLWVRFLKMVLVRSSSYLADVLPDRAAGIKRMNLYLHVLIVFTSCNTWAILQGPKGAALKASLQQLCDNILSHLVVNGMYRNLSVLLRKGMTSDRPALKAEPLKAVVLLSLRPFKSDSPPAECVKHLTLHVLTVPAFVYHVHVHTQDNDCTEQFRQCKIFERTLALLTGEHDSRAFTAEFTGVTALNLLANLIHLGSFERESLVENLLDFTHVVTRLLERCKSHMVGGGTKSCTNHWHPIFGWFTQRLDENTQCTMPLITKQLQFLWSREMVRCLFRDLINSASVEPTTTQPGGSGSRFDSKDLKLPVAALLKKLAIKPPPFLSVGSSASSSKKSYYRRFGSTEATLVALVCCLYRCALSTFVQLQSDILSGLCREDFLLPKLWQFICGLGPESGLKAFLELLEDCPKAIGPQFDILILFCDAAACVTSILDETELYEQEKLFRQNQLAIIGRFCNVFVFRSVWNGLIDTKSIGTHALFNSVYHLGMVLYGRHCRRPFTADPNVWQIKEVKASSIISELEKNNQKAVVLMQRIPHMIPHKDRVILFRKYVHADKVALGIINEVDHHDVPSTLITVYRARLVEDGYRQLSLLNTKAIKGTIRVKFVNEQGLDEAGIDQDGVFKEFLEETIRKVFDPTLNLFRSTNENRLYPSSTSDIHDNHLALFDFIGRMLAKAVYEGIVVDISFASFFLSSLLGRRFSAFDELPNLDMELYKNLTYIKHYDGDVSDLELTFSVDEQNMGQLVTHDLVPGGRTIVVNGQNKITYIHKMANFRLVEQVKLQTKAFVAGFQSIISPAWTSLFSPGELQKLISGSSDDIDLVDLRKHTQYYGGFHNSHRLVVWLWEILEKDFTADERHLFLKFVTSCSKAPLLGFAHLEPQFSIRCVEVAEDQDHGDTLGSVIRGFLAVRRHQEPSTARLPTSSTCFNLLKLPNYQKKSTLKEKLRYAIHSGTGFELS